MMSAEDPIVIVGAARTPMGGFLGDFKDVAAPALGARAIAAAVERAGVAPDSVDEVLMGCVLPAGQGQAPARQASLGAGLPLAAGCTTINKVCGSGMKAAMVATDLLRAGSADVAVAGGMESMSNAPYLLDRARAGYRMGHGRTIDHMFLDGLEDAYDKGRLMGTFAEDCAQAYQFTRREQDDYALASLERANRAIREGAFSWEIAPVSVKAGKSETLVSTDEQPPKARPDKIPTLKAAFREGGTVTAANSSSISDGAAALVMMRLSEAEKHGAAPLARVVAHASHAAESEGFSDRADRRAEKTLRQDRLEQRFGRPFRDQRGLRGRRDGGDAGSVAAAREGQRQRRRLRPRPSDRRLGGADSGDADRRAQGAGPETRRRRALHRRGRGDGDGDRGGVAEGGDRFPPPLFSCASNAATTVSQSLRSFRHRPPIMAELRARGR